jgi:hypothetical protein
MKKESQESIDREVQQALEELGIADVDWARKISAEDILYFLNQCPFLYISNTVLPLSPEKSSLQIVTASSGWNIHNYGHALSSSPGEFLLGNYRSVRPQEEDERGRGDAVAVPGAGTVVNQAVTTAFAMVDLAIQQSWTGIQFVDGHPLMAWAAWMHALDAEVSLEGYQPTAKDFSRRRRIHQSLEELQPRRPTPT